MESNTLSTPTVDDAITYAAQGWPIFPLHTIDATGQCTCAKDCERNAGKHPRTGNGLLNATTNSETIERWWDRWPDSNIGLATGQPAGVFVLDIDPDKGGWESADALEEAHGPLPATSGVETGGAGLHLYFRWPDHGVIKNDTSKKLGPGLDVRGQGGYVLLPPSLHRSGRHYSWATIAGADGETPDQIAQAPDWLLTLLVEKPPPPPIARSVPWSPGVAAEGPIAEGERNSTLASKAGLLRRYGFSEAEIQAALEQMNLDRCRPPLPDAEVAKIARSIASRYAPGYSSGGTAAQSVRLAGGFVFQGGRRYGR